jgi:hypothetical protein
MHPINVEQQLTNQNTKNTQGDSFRVWRSDDMTLLHRPPPRLRRLLLLPDLSIPWVEALLFLLPICVHMWKDQRLRQLQKCCRLQNGATDLNSFLVLLVLLPSSQCQGLLSVRAMKKVDDPAVSCVPNMEFEICRAWQCIVANSLLANHKTNKLNFHENYTLHIFANFGIMFS